MLLHPWNLAIARSYVSFKDIHAHIEGKICLAILQKSDNQTVVVLVFINFILAVFLPESVVAQNEGSILWP